MCKSACGCQIRVAVERHRQVDAGPGSRGHAISPSSPDRSPPRVRLLHSMLLYLQAQAQAIVRLSDRAESRTRRNSAVCCSLPLLQRCTQCRYHRIATCAAEKLHRRRSGTSGTVSALPRRTAEAWTGDATRECIGLACRLRLTPIWKYWAAC